MNTKLTDQPDLLASLTLLQARDGFDKLSGPERALELGLTRAYHELCPSSTTQDPIAEWGSITQHATAIISENPAQIASAAREKACVVQEVFGTPYDVSLRLFFRSPRMLGVKLETFTDRCKAYNFFRKFAWDSDPAEQLMPTWFDISSATRNLFSYHIVRNALKLVTETNYTDNSPHKKIDLTDSVKESLSASGRALAKDYLALDEQDRFGLPLEIVERFASTSILEELAGRRSCVGEFIEIVSELLREPKPVLQDTSNKKAPLYQALMRLRNGGDPDGIELMEALWKFCGCSHTNGEEYGHERAMLPKLKLRERIVDVVQDLSFDSFNKWTDTFAMNFRHDAARHQRLHESRSVFQPLSEEHLRDTRSLELALEDYASYVVIVQEIKKLRPKLRDAVIAMCLKGQSDDEYALAAGISPISSRTRLHLARALLRKNLIAEFPRLETRPEDSDAA